MAEIEILHPDDGSGLEYRAIELDNGLCALLVRDAYCQGESGSPAAASMAVRVGSFFDPPEAQGLAHFLEHMLFRGSEKFPKSDFDIYLSKHGGDSNAHTCMEHTIFQLHVQPKFLRPTLDRFSQFFIAPLLDHGRVEKEIYAVNAEFELRKHNDYFRLDELRARTSKKGHMFNRFSCGNKESLNNENLRKHAKKLFDECYLGGAMKLCVIGGEGKGSLYAFFKDEGWTYSIQVILSFHGRDCTSLGRLFLISMDLTLSGLENKNQLISYTYQYLKLLRDTEPQRWVMEEFWNIKSIEYRLEMGAYPPEFAKRLSANMLWYPLTHVIFADYSSKWNPKAVVDLMKYFTPERMRIDFASKSVEGTELEPWCKALYIEEQIPPEFREAWRNTSEVHPSLYFPSQNKFIPTSFEPREHIDFLHPQCIHDTPYLKLWHDCKSITSSFFYFRIYHKTGYSSVRDHVLMELFTELVKDELSGILHQSKAARLSSTITLGYDQLLLKVSGYREKLSLLLSEIWTSFMNFSPTAKRFEVIKEEIKKDLNNMELKEQSDYMLFQILSEGPYNMCKKLQVLNKMSFDDLERFVPGIRSEIFIEGMCGGDLLSAEVLEISKIFQSTQVDPLPKHLRHETRIVRLRTKLRRIHAKVSNNNSLIKLYFQIGHEEGKSLRKRAMIDLFYGIIREMLFDKLRNEEQLGYVVECSTHLTCGVHGFNIQVVSTKHDPFYLLERVCKFVSLVGGELEKVTNKSFEDYKSGVISRLKNDINDTWEEIVSKRYMFDYYSEEVAELEMIKKTNLIKFYRKYFRVSSPYCHRVAICLWEARQT